MNRQNRANTRSAHRARGAVRLGGVIAAVLVAALAVALVVVLKRALTSPAPTHAGAPGVGGSGGAAASEELRQAASEALTQREYPKAAALYKRMLEDPDAAEDVDLRLSLVEALLGQQDYAGAYEQYEKIIAIQGKNVSPATHFQAGTVASKAGRLDRAEEHYSMAQAADMSRFEYPLFLGMVQLRQGGEKTEAGLASLLRAIKLNPECAEAYGTIAEVYLRDNKLEIVGPNIARARELQPEVARWRLVEARLLKRQGKPAEALTLLTAMDPADQASPEAVSLMAECYGMLQRPADAAELFAKAAKRDPSNAENHYQAAMWYHRAGDAEKARAFAKTAAMLGHEGAKQLQNSLG